MDGIKKIVWIACIVAVIISMIDILYPGKKFAGQIRLLFSLVFILSVAVPIINTDFEMPNIQSYEASDGYLSVNQNVQDVFKSTAEENISVILIKKLEDNGIIAKEIKTSVNILSDNSISINEVKIFCENPTDKIPDIIQREVGIDTEIIIYKLQE